MLGSNVFILTSCNSDNIDLLLAFYWWQCVLSVTMPVLA